jgi:hypothetical protein
MNWESLGSAIGGGLATAGLVAAGARKWFRPSDERLDDLTRQIQTPDKMPSIADLVVSTATAVQRLEGTANGTRVVLDDVVRGQRNLTTRVDVIETKHDALDARVTLALHTERIAEILADKTEEIAKALAGKTEAVAAALAKHQAEDVAAMRARKDGS